MITGDSSVAELIAQLVEERDQLRHNLTQTQQLCNQQLERLRLRSRPEADALIGKYFPVLDYGYVCLLDYMGGDAAIEQAARVSYQAGTRKTSDRRSLIRSLMRRKHSSPFEHVEIKLSCAMPIFVARQWIRTRTANLNEVSGRYSVLPKIYYTPSPEQICEQSTKDKQGRGDVSPFKEEFLQRLSEHRQDANILYDWALDHGIARELARIDLPLSLYTRWVWKIDGNNLLKTLSLRCDPHAQWEIQQYFNVIAGIAKTIMPLAFEAWEDYQLNAVSLSREDRRLLTDGSKPTSEDAAAFESLIARLALPEKRCFDLDLASAKSAEYFEEIYSKE